MSQRGDASVSSQHYIPAFRDFKRSLEHLVILEEVSSSKAFRVYEIMGKSFLMLSMWSAISAFTALMLLVHVVILVLRWFGVEIWNDAGGSPHTVL